MKNKNDAIRNRIIGFDKRRISQPKTQLKKPAMNKRTLLIAAVFHFVHPVEKNITSWLKTLSASAVKVNNFQDAA